MIYPEIAELLIEMRNADLAVRERLIQNGQLGKGYYPEMKKVHLRNTKQLEQIIQKIGYPTQVLVGQEASEAAWLIVQHSIEQPTFMKKCLQLLEVEVQNHQVSAKDLAYLGDRIAVLEGKPQCYGTQFDWNDQGQLVPNEIENPSEVNQRRSAIGLTTLEEQTALIRHQAELENQNPPTDWWSRKLEIDRWKRSVGWIS